MEKSVFELAAKEMEELIKANCFVYYYYYDYYPRLLRECVDSPLLVYSKKPLFDWNNCRVISIIGTRQPSSRGIAFCEKLVDDLSYYNPVIVSGLA